MKKNSVTGLGLAVALILALGPVFGDGTPSPTEDHAKKIKEIEEMLTLSGGLDGQRKLIPVMIEQMRGSLPNVPQKFWDNFEKETLASLPELNQQLFAIYDQHFTQSEIEAYITFYKTPAGQKYARETPAVTQEAYTAGTAWGKGIAEKVDVELKKAGYQ